MSADSGHSCIRHAIVMHSYMYIHVYKYMLAKLYTRYSQDISKATVHVTLRKHKITVDCRTKTLKYYTTCMLVQQGKRNSTFICEHLLCCRDVHELFLGLLTLWSLRVLVRMPLYCQLPVGAVNLHSLCVSAKSRYYFTILKGFTLNN